MPTIVCGNHLGPIHSRMFNRFAAQARLCLTTVLAIASLQGPALIGQTPDLSLIDYDIGRYYFESRCSGCHGTEPSYIHRGPSLQQLTGRSTGQISHGGGSEAYADVDLRQLAAYLSSQDTNRYSLTGVVLDADGIGRAGVTVTISSTYLPYDPRTTVTAEDGGYRFDDLPAGDHQMVAAASQSNFNPPLVELQAVQLVDSGSALFVVYGTNEPAPEVPPLTTIRVAPFGDDQASGRAWSAAKRTIRGGLGACPTGGEVWVAEGTYYEAVIVQDQTLVGGFAGHEARKNQRDWRHHVTIVDADPAHLAEIGFPPSTAVTLTSPSGEGAGCDGLTVQNGYGDVGGGIRVDAWATATIENCTISSNASAYVGGGIFCDQSAIVHIGHNVVRRNSSGTGGALYCSFDAVIELTDNLFALNNALASGGMYSDGYVSNMVNNTFVQNSSDDGSAAILEWDGSGNNFNNIVAFNTAGIDSFGTESTWNHNAVFGNTNFDWNNLSPGPTDVVTDPGFKDVDNGDFHLRANSPCRDAGDDTSGTVTDVDLDNEPRRSRRHVDIGAYELPPPTLSSVRDGSGIHLTWPLDETGFILEQSTGSNTRQWETTGSPAISAGNWSVTVPTTEHAALFRLRQPF